MGEDANDGKGYWRWNRLLEIRQILEMGQDSAYATGCYTRDRMLNMGQDTASVAVYLR